MIFKVLSEEEDKFNRTIDQGLAILADMEEDMNKKGEKVLIRRQRIQALRYVWIPDRT